MQPLSLGVIIWIIMFGLISRRIFVLKREISFLPISYETHFMKHPLVNVDIKQRIVIPNQYRRTSFYLIILSTNCPPCHQMLEEIIQEGLHKKAPIALYVYSGEDETFKVFNKEFSESVSYIPISDSELENLKINFFPAFIKVNNKGIVRKVTPRNELYKSIPK